MLQWELRQAHRNSCVLVLLLHFFPVLFYRLTDYLALDFIEMTRTVLKKANGAIFLIQPTKEILSILPGNPKSHKLIRNDDI